MPPLRVILNAAAHLASKLKRVTPSQAGSGPGCPSSEGFDLPAGRFIPHDDNGPESSLPLASKSSPKSFGEKVRDKAGDVLLASGLTSTAQTIGSTVGNADRSSPEAFITDIGKSVSGKAEKEMRTAIHNTAATINGLKQDLSEAKGDIKALKANMEQVSGNIELLLKKCCGGRPVGGGGTPLGKASGNGKGEGGDDNGENGGETAVMFEALIRLN